MRFDENECTVSMIPYLQTKITLLRTLYLGAHPFFNSTVHLVIQTAIPHKIPHAIRPSQIPFLLKIAIVCGSSLLVGNSTDFSPMEYTK